MNIAQLKRIIARFFSKKVNKADFQIIGKQLTQFSWEKRKSISTS